MRSLKVTIETARCGYRNLLGIVVISVLATLATIPLVATVWIGTSIAVLGGLWATCLLLGMVTIAAFHFTTSVIERGVSIPIVPSVVFAFRHSMLGLALGATLFFVIISPVVLTGIAPPPMRPMAVGFAGFLLLGWYLLTAFGSPELGAGRSLRVAFGSSFNRIGHTPAGIVWFLAVSLFCTVLAGLTVLSLVLLLPGTLALVAARAARLADSAESDDQ